MLWGEWARIDHVITFVLIVTGGLVAWGKRKGSKSVSTSMINTPIATLLYLSIGTAVWLFGAFLVAFPDNFLTEPWPPVEFGKIATKFFETNEKHRTFIPLLITLDVVVGFFIERPNGNIQADEPPRRGKLFLLAVSVCTVIYVLVAVVAAANMPTIHGEHASAGLVIAFSALFLLRAMTLYQPHAGRPAEEFESIPPKAAVVLTSPSKATHT